MVSFVNRIVFTVASLDYSSSTSVNESSVELWKGIIQKDAYEMDVNKPKPINRP